jgi:hypothetical protein
MIPADVAALAAGMPIVVSGTASSSRANNPATNVVELCSVIFLHTGSEKY